MTTYVQRRRLGIPCPEASASRTGMQVPTRLRARHQSACAAGAAAVREEVLVPTSKFTSGPLVGY